MSVINVYHEIRNVSIKKGKKVVDEEYLIQGEKGLKIKYFHKDDKDSEKIVITGKDGVYKMKSTVNGETEEKDLDEKGLEKELKGKLKFAKEQLKGGAKKPNDSDLIGGKRGSKKSGSKKSGSKKAGSKKSGSKKSGSKKSSSRK
jgi:hypothetical protein